MKFIGKNKNDKSGFKAVASGTLSTGDIIVLNSDGTVSAVGVSTTPQSQGSPVTFDSDYVDFVTPVHDTYNDRIVVLYKDFTGNDDGVAVVGTVSGDTITFGPETQFESGTTNYIVACFDSVNNKVIVCFTDASNSNYSKAVSGTVDPSNNTISFSGASTQIAASSFQKALSFDSNSGKSLLVARDSNASRPPYYRLTSYVLTLNSNGEVIHDSTGVGVGYSNNTYIELCSCFDSSTNRVVVACRNNSASNRGTAFVGEIGTGNNVTWGDGVQFELGITQAISIAFDSNANKVVIVFGDASNSNYGKAVVGTVDPSDNSISFGTIRTFASYFIDKTSIAFDSFTNEMVIHYVDRSSNTYAGKYLVATVSGSDITFEAEQSFSDTNPIYQFGTTFDASSKQVVVGYRYGNSLGKALLFKNTITSTNLESDNFIGTVSDGYASGQTATINVSGFIDDSQSGLTLGQSYYAHGDGTLSTTPSDPVVFVGTAVSDTELRISEPSGTILRPGTFGGDIVVDGEFISDSYNETYVTLSGTSPAVNCETGNVFSLETSGDTSFTFTNPPASGTAYGFTLKVKAAGTHVLNWPTSVDWAGGTAPNAPASGETNLLVFITHDSGVTWYGFQAGAAMA